MTKVQEWMKQVHPTTASVCLHSRQNVGSRERGIRNDDCNSKEVASASLTTG
jgi:hypothetical protein